MVVWWVVGAVRGGEVGGCVGAVGISVIKFGAVVLLMVGRQVGKRLARTVGRRLLCVKRWITLLITLVTLIRRPTTPRLPL